MKNGNKKPKNSAAKIAANNRYSKKNYKQFKIDIRESERNYIYSVARKYNISNAELIRRAVKFYDDNIGGNISD